MQLGGLEPLPKYIDMNLNHARMPISPQLLMNRKAPKPCIIRVLDPFFLIPKIEIKLEMELKKSKKKILNIKY